MSKYLSLLILFLAFMVCCAFTIETFGQKKSAKITSKHKYIELENLVLEQETLAICPFFKYKKGMACDGDKKSINVSAIAKGELENGLTYRYFVTGGKIIGKGANVIWDFTDTKMGNYSITVALAKDSIVKGKIITKLFKYSECDTCDPPCECPILSISAPKEIAKAGDGIIFSADINERFDKNLTYNWTISSGIIETGQGTKQVIVRTDKDKKEQVVTATVEIVGLCAECPNTTSATIKLDNK